MVEVTVRTRILTLPELPKKRLERLNLIHDLHCAGMNDREIADHLNGLGLETPRGGSYSAKLVWVTLKKFKDRLERLEDTTLTVNRVYPAKQERDFSLDGGQIEGLSLSK